MTNGIEAIVVAGTSGENSTLEIHEHAQLVDFSIRKCAGKAKVLVGVGGNNTLACLKKAKSAAEAGADAVMMTAPYYNKCSKDGMIEHFMTIADEVDVPLILYNVPSRTGLDIPVSVYQRLARIPNIVGVKEASTDVSKIAKIRSVCGNDFAVWSGNDDFAVPAISIGASGLISVISNIAPVETNAMVQASLDGDFDSAADLQCRLTPLIETLFCEVNPIPVKAAMRCIGYDCGQCRLPLTGLSGANQEKINKLLS